MQQTNKFKINDNDDNKDDADDKVHRDKLFDQHSVYLFYIAFSSVQSLHAAHLL